MKISTNKKELKLLGACRGGYEKFIKAHGDNEVKLSECIDSNGWDDVWWLIRKAESQFSDKQKHDLRVFGCNAALINIEKIKPYCANNDYQIIIDYLNNPTESAESAWSAAWSAARSAARSARSAAESAAWSAAWSAARSAESAAESAAWSAAWSAARSAESAAWSAAWSAARSAAWSARSAAESAELAELAAESAARSARLAEMKKFTQKLKDLFLTWEKM